MAVFETFERLDQLHVGMVLEQIARGLTELRELMTTAQRAQAAAEARASAAAFAEIQSVDADGVALAFNIPLDTARQLMRSGALPTFSVGKHLRVRVADLRRYQEAQHTAVPTPPRRGRTLRAVQRSAALKQRGTGSEPDAPGAAAWSEPDDSAS
jgi:hypothetical protein